MSDETPAAAPAPAETNTPIASAPATEAPAPIAEPANAPTQAPETVPADGATNTNSYFTNEQLADMQRMFENNGGFEKAWGKMKDAISRPQAVNAPEAPQAPAQPQVQPTPTQAPEAPQPASQAPKAGTYSLEELAAQNYFDRLAGEDKYAPIASEIRNGSVLKGLKDFNITPITDGRVNDAEIRKYLDLYAASKPAVQTTTVTDANSRVDYYSVPDEKAMTYEQATQIELQNIRLQAAGQPLHPLTDRAKEVVKAHFTNKK